MNWGGTHHPNIHTLLDFLISNCSNASNFLGWRYLQLCFLLLEFLQLQTQKAYKHASDSLWPIKCTLFICRMPADKNFKATFFYWYVFPFQLVQSANTEFLFNKNTSKLNKAGLFEGIFFSLSPSSHLHISRITNLILI